MGTKTLTILFTDIVGSTELMAELSERDAERLRKDHFEVLGQQVKRFGGRQVKNLGDGLMASFESARSGIECGIAMQQASARQGGGRATRAISIRVGLSSGDVHADGDDCFGLPVVEASRLCAEAPGGHVLLAESTRLLTRGYEPLREVGELALKGLPAPTRAWVAPWSAETPTTVRAILADDAVLVREGVAHVLDKAGIEVVAQAGDAEELMLLAEELRPDIAIVDVRMPPTHTVEGLEAARRLRTEHSGIGVLVLSQEVEPHYAEKLLAASLEGVGYLLKERVADVSEFAEAVRKVAAGGTAFEPAVISALLGGNGASGGGIRELTEEDRHALAGVAE
jgi:class 3 adenylate cyclase/DNA-binding NarL/FixJ family response regulator